ncbi:hypothetical protein R1flu_006719 [Riccia fluitans]|uniref:N-alpha-acetyltransferase 40 n=1 Tax=Riccia fluitans TaxID=41844 RepID=A0ABD1YWT3_9MARC
MERNSSKPSSKDKKQKRKQELARKKALDDLLKVAYSKENILAEFPAFLKFQRNGLNLNVEYATGKTLSSSVKEYIMKLCTVNMEVPFGEDWPQEQKNKRREMVSAAARYIILRQNTGSQVDAKGEAEAVENESREKKHEGLWLGEGDPVVAFVQFRFMIEHDVPVLYVYELQLESCVQRKGLGRFLMQFCELIGRKNQMKGVMLTVQKKNTGAVNFYLSKLKYSVSALSPSRWGTVAGADANYEILCKTFDPETKVMLEDGFLE